MNSFWCERMPAPRGHAYDCAAGRGHRMRIITLNCDGIRSAAGKGLFEWLPRRRADVICLQETKAQEHQLGDPCLRPRGHFCAYFDAKRPGYSGVAVLSKKKPDKVVTGFGV